MVDIDGVVSLFGFSGDPSMDGSFHQIDGIPHFLSAAAAAHLLALGRIFDLVWASGWEEKANEHLPHLLGLGAPLPFLRFPRSASSRTSHWKLDSIDAYCGRRPLAWIDDSFNAACHEWAEARPAPTLLVSTSPEHGLTSREARLLEEWAGGLQAG
jgi:hypothetical protein